MLRPVTVIGPGRYACHRCGSPNLYRDYTAGGAVIACLMCGERMEPGRNERHGGVDGHAVKGSDTACTPRTSTPGRGLKKADTAQPVSSPAHADQKQEKPMTEFIRRCQNCGRDAQLSGPLCVGICYLAAKGKTGEEREKALREARERVARGEYRGGSHWAGSRKIAARQGRAEAMRLNGFITRLEHVMEAGHAILEEIKEMRGRG